MGPLTSPIHLFEKLQHDLDELRAAPNDAYLAFNFFATAVFMIDWMTDDQAKREEVLGQSLELQAARDIVRGDMAVEIEDVQPNGTTFLAALARLRHETRLVVHLRNDAAIKFGETIRAVDLANAVLKFWRTYSTQEKPTDVIQPSS
jgi:hypothetical protein